MHDKKDIKDRKKYIGDESYDMKSTSCPFCNKPGNVVGINFRVPKKADKKGWELLQKLLCSSYNDLKNMESDKNEKFVYLFYLKSGGNVIMHDYEDRWNITDKNNEGYPRVRAIMFGDDHFPKYYSYPSKLREYAHFLKEVKDGRKYFFSASERWRMIRMYLKSLSLIRYWQRYSSSKVEIRNALNIDPKYNVIKHFDKFKTIYDLRHKVQIPKDILFLICRKLFD